MRAPRSFGTVLLLALALVLVGVLVFQAQDAVRSHQRIAEATLNDYASFADWQLTQQTKSSVLSPIILSLSAQASRVDPRRLAETVVSPEQAEADARAITEPWCRCLGGVKYFFRYDWSDGTFRTTGTRPTNNHGEAARASLPSSSPKSSAYCRESLAMTRSYRRSRHASSSWNVASGSTSRPNRARRGRSREWYSISSSGSSARART